MKDPKKSKVLWKQPVYLHNFHAQICSDSFPTTSTAAPISNSWWSIARRCPNHHDDHAYVLYLTSNATNAEMTRGWNGWTAADDSSSRPILHPPAVVAYTTDPQIAAPLPGANDGFFQLLGGAKKKLGSNHGHLNRKIVLWESSSIQVICMYVQHNCTFLTHLVSQSCVWGQGAINNNSPPPPPPF